MKNNRFEITIIISLLVVSVIIFFLYQLFDLIFNKDKFIIITNPINVISCKKGECNSETNYKGYASSKYYLYINDEIIENTKFKYNEGLRELSVYSKSEEEVASYSDRFMLSNSKKLRFYDFDEETMNDSEIRRLAGNYEYPVYANKIVLDLDNDGNYETLYFMKVHNQEGIYSTVAFESLGYIEKIEEDKAKDDYKAKTLFISGIIDVNNDGVLELIITKVGYDNTSHCTMLYKLENSSYIPMNECKMVNY